ncbi:MAG: hypothetical protein NTW16_00755 [Bacteroidetes bacterium]|nr:hypothetical protein [Bacteroidota bacterium]
MKNSKTIVIFIMVLAAAAGVYWFIWKKKKDQGAAETAPAIKPGAPIQAAPGAASANQGTKPAPKYFIKKGDDNKDVKFLQMRLNQKFNAGLEMDGKYGPKTAAAITKAGKNGSALFYADYMALIK